ncbi:diamine N-acetyltransferase [Enterococcus sp. AZ194]|uniref:GNAT family N-acetyltransferase n=1 Tax=Enterococcus sp. AZ194 TaxID=2774629 RepID=UPI003F23B297
MYPGDEGADFVSSNAYSLIQTYYEGTWSTKGIVYNSEAVGFTMYGFDQETNRYELCRLMIDYRHQNKGLGKKSLSFIINEMVTSLNCQKIFLSTRPENKRAISLYESFGFYKTGELLEEECVFCLDM